MISPPLGRDDQTVYFLACFSHGAGSRLRLFKIGKHPSLCPRFRRTLQRKMLKYINIVVYFAGIIMAQPPPPPPDRPGKSIVMVNVYSDFWDP